MVPMVSVLSGCTRSWIAPPTVSLLALRAVISSHSALSIAFSDTTVRLISGRPRMGARKGAMILIFGPPGVGKSHVGCGIGHALIDAGYRVLTMRTSELVQRLQASGQSVQLPQVLAKLDRYDLLILDDRSYVRKDQAETSVLFELIAERYDGAASSSRPTSRSPAGTTYSPTRV